MSQTPVSGREAHQPQTSPREHGGLQRAAPLGKVLSTLKDWTEVAVARAREDGSDIVALGKTFLSHSVCVIYIEHLFFLFFISLQLMAFECPIHHCKGATH